MKVKKNVSLEDTIFEKGKARGKSMGMNFSNYITYLINRDIGEIAITENPKKKNSKLSSGIDNILDM